MKKDLYGDRVVVDKIETTYGGSLCGARTMIPAPLTYTVQYLRTTQKIGQRPPLYFVASVGYSTVLATLLAIITAN